MINMDRLYCLQWSDSQKCWHSDYLNRVMKDDLERLCYEPNNPNDWVTIAVSFDLWELNLLAEKIDAIRKRRVAQNG